MRRRQSTIAALGFTALTGALVAACSGEPPQRISGEINLEADRPQLETARPEPPEYTGTDPYVMEAAMTHRTVLDLHRNVVLRTCGPTSGVCHNQKEYPDLHTPGNMLNIVGAPCNIQSADPNGVYDGCEQPGDRLTFRDNGAIEIGYVDLVPGEYVNYEDQGIVPDATSPGLHVYLPTPVQEERETVYGPARFARAYATDGATTDLTYGEFDTRWWILDGGTHLLGEVRNYQIDDVGNIMAAGVIEGDRNRNGIYGARDVSPLAMITPGSPESSYLVGRLRGVLGDNKIPGTRMPLANQPLSIADMLAVFCFIEGLPETTEVIDVESRIDYVNCSYSQDPEALNLLGLGVSWLGRVQPLLEANCGGCHSGETPIGGTVFVGDNAYETLLGPSKQRPDLPLINPLDPEGSYLYQKLMGAEGIVGLSMPIDPVGEVRPLPDATLTDIRTWIENGALEED